MTEVKQGSVPGPETLPAGSAAPAVRRPALGRRLAWLLGVPVVLVGLILAALAWALPPWLKPRLEAEGTAWLGTPVVIQQLAVRPLALEVELTGLRIGTAEAPLFTLGGLLVDVSGSSLWRLTPVVSQLRVREPQLHVSRAKAPPPPAAGASAPADPGYNFSPVLAHLRARLAALPPRPPEPADRHAAPPPFELHQIHLSGGLLSYDDERLGQHHRIEQLEIALPLLSSLPADVARPVLPRLSARIDGSRFELDAQARPFAPGRPAELTLQWQGYPLAPWADLLRAVLPSALAPSGLAGSLDAKLALSFAPAPAPGPSAAAASAVAASGAASATAGAASPAPAMQLAITGELGLSGFKLVLPAQGADVAWRALRLEGLELAPLQGRYALKRALFDQLDASLTRQPAATRVRPGAAESAASAPPVAPPAASMASAGAAGPAGAPAAAAPVLELAKLACQACRIVWIDAQGAAPVRFELAPLDLALTGLTADLSRPVGLHLDTGIAAVAAAGAAARAQADAPGRLKLDGQLAVQDSRGAPARFGQPGARLALNGQLDLAALDLRLAQPYLTPVLNLDLQAGRLATAGELALLLALDGAAAAPPPSPTSVGASAAAGTPATAAVPMAAPSPTSTATSAAPASLPRVSYRGRLAVDGLRSFIGVAGDELLAWRRFGFDGLDLAWQPDALQAGLGRIALDGLRARLIILPDGHLNLADIVRRDPAAAGAGAAPAGAASAPVTAAASAPAQPPAAAAGRPPVLSWQQITLSDGAVYFTDRHMRPGFSAHLGQLAGTLSAVSSARPEPARIELAGAVDDVAPLRIAGRVHPLGVRAYTDIDASARGIPLTRLSGYAERYAGYAIERGSLSVKLNYKIEDGRLQADNQLFLDQLTFGAEVASPDAVKLPVRLAVALLKNSRGEIDIRLPVAGTLDDPQFSIGGVIWRVLVNLVGKAITAPFSLLFGGGGEQADAGQIDFAPGSAELDTTGRVRLDQLAERLLDRPGLKLEATGLADPARDSAELQRLAQAQVRAAAPAASAASAAGVAVAASAPAPAPAPALEGAALQQALRELADRRAERVLAHLGASLPIERVGLVRSQVSPADQAGAQGDAPSPLTPSVRLRVF
ncbi:MAG: hypothetical protein RLZZ584_1734 [Pseudomonadota bacterium]